MPEAGSRNHFLLLSETRRTSDSCTGTVANQGLGGSVLGEGLGNGAAYVHRSKVSISFEAQCLYNFYFSKEVSN